MRWQVRLLLSDLIEDWLHFILDLLMCSNLEMRGGMQLWLLKVMTVLMMMVLSLVMLMFVILEGSEVLHTILIYVSVGLVRDFPLDFLYLLG